LDVELPKIKDTDLLKYMRSEKRLRYIPVVVMTASSDYIKLQMESYKPGVTFFISKPFERSSFEMIFKTLVKA
jgi:FixJ family two-component response regulator